MDEKRDNTRFPLIADIDYQGGGAQQRGRVSDLSRGGLFIDTINPLPQGVTLSFSFSLPGDKSGNPVNGQGIVAWVQPMVGMGVRFTFLQDGDYRRIDAFLKRR